MFPAPCDWGATATRLEAESASGLCMTYDGVALALDQLEDMARDEAAGRRPRLVWSG